MRVRGVGVGKRRGLLCVFVLGEEEVGRLSCGAGFFGGTGVGRGGICGLLMGSEEFMWLERGPREDGEGF